MAVAYGTTGTVAYSTGNPAPTYPTGITAGDLLVLLVGTKPAGFPATTPSGWTSLGGFESTTGTSGIDTGPMRVDVFYKVAGGTESGTLSVAIPGNNVSAANIYRWTNGTGVWDLAVTFGQDTAGGTSWSAACNSAGSYNFTAGDGIMFGGVIPTDVTTPSQFSAGAVTASGATFAAATEIQEWDTSSGQDMGGFIYRTTVSSGSSTSAPTVTATAGGTTTNVYGPSFVLRIREQAAAYSGSATRSETVTVTAAGSKGTSSGATLAQTVNRTATGSTGVSGTATRSQTVTVTATGSVVTAYSGTASRSETVNRTATGQVGKSSTATRSVTVTTTATGQVTRNGTASRSVTVNRTAAGQVGRSSGATRPITVTVVAAGAVGKSGTAARSETVTVTTTGAVTGSGVASRTETVTITATGSVTVGISGAATRSQTVTIIASGVVERLGSATRPVTVTATATGSVISGVAGAASRAQTVTIAAAGQMQRNAVSTRALVAVLTATGAVAGQIYRIVTPTSEQVYTDVVPANRYGIDTAKTIILKDGVVTVTDYPDTLTLSEADAYYVGGRDYIITQDEYNAIVAAGRPDLVEQV